MKKRKVAAANQASEEAIPSFDFHIPSEESKSKERETPDHLAEGKLTREEKELNRKTGKQLRKILELHPVKSWGSRTDENFVRYTSGYFEILRIRGKNLFGMRPEEFQQLMASYGALSSLYDQAFKLVSIHSAVNTTEAQGFYKREFQRSTDPGHRQILEEKYGELAFIAKYRQMEEYYVFVYGYDEDKLRENLEKFYKCLGVIQVDRMTREEKVQLLFQMANPALKLAPQVPRGFEVKSKRILQEGIDIGLLSRIQPQGNLKIGETAIQTGTGFSACLTTYRLQSEPDYLWLNPFTKIKDKILTLDVATQDDENLRNDITKALGELQSRYNTSKDATEKEIVREEYQSLLQLSKDVRKGREIIKYVTIRLYLYAESLDELEKRIFTVRKELQKEEFGVVSSTLEQGYDWQSMFLDYYSQMLLPNTRSGLDVTSTVFGASFPANQVYLMDPRGQYLGLSNTNGQMIVDFFEITGGRTFYNILLTGLMGRGKTTLMKKIMRDMIGRGYMIRGFDKSGEFTKLVKHEKGTIIRLDGQDGRINIFEVFPLAINDTTLEVSEQASFITHLSKLGTWYSILKPTAPLEELDQFDTLVSDLYVVKGLSDAEGKVEKVTGLPPNAYPILADLLELLVRRYSESTFDEERKHLYNIQSTLTTLMKKTSTLFNGPTTIPDFSNQQILFFNIDGLSNFDPRFVNAQLFNAFNLFVGTLFNNGRREHRRYQDGEIKFEAIKRGMFFMAEAHNLLNGRNPRMVEYFNTFAREARKRYSGLCLDTQSIRSLVSQQENNSGDSELNDIYDFMQYRFFFQPGQEELKTLGKSNGGPLADEEVELVSKFEPHKTLLKITSGEAYEMRVYASPEELALFDGGGRKATDTR